MARRVTGLDQKALARRVGVIHQKLGRWERGQAVPSRGERGRLIEILDAAQTVLELSPEPADARLVILRKKRSS